MHLRSTLRCVVGVLCFVVFCVYRLSIEYHFLCAFSKWFRVFVFVRFHVTGMYTSSKSSLNEIIDKFDKHDTAFWDRAGVCKKKK